MKDKDTKKNWLQRLKDESWEAELLVSAIAIFSAFKLFDVIDWLTNFFINVLNPNQYLIGYFIIFFGLIAISVLISMFVLHFFLRAYWVGLVGLNSVFPDYSLENSAYSKIYTEKILSILPKLKDSIQKVDELCSVIFSVAFTFLLAYGYVALSSSIYLLLYNSLSEYINHYILLIPFFLGLASLILQSIINIYANLKFNKEKIKLQTLNFKVTKFASMLSFGPLYKNILQVSMIFGSNFKKKKSLTYLMILFLISGFVVATVQIPKTNILFLIDENDKYFDVTKVYASFYDDENTNNTFLLTPEIQSDEINTSVLRIFIPIFKYENKIRTQICGLDEIDSEKPLNIRRKEHSNYVLNCFKQYYQIFINNKKIEAEFLRYDAHARTKQTGLISYINISDLKKGLQTIKIKKELRSVKTSNWTIPFYYNPRD